MKKELLFSLNKNDFNVQYFRGSGKGGQKKQKTSSACRIVHIISGATGISQDSRSQLQNRTLAFQRCINSQKFQTWFKLEKASRLKGYLDFENQIKNIVDEQMQEKNIKIEYYCSNE